MKQKIIAIVSLLMVIVALFSGCANDTNGLEFESVFSGDATLSIIMRVKTEKVDYKIDEIEIELSFGSEHELPGFYENDDRQSMGVAVYICNEVDLKTKLLWDEEVGDYTNIEGWHFVRFVDIDEYHSKDYSAKSNWPGVIKAKFNHKETLMVPQNILMTASESPRKYVCIVVMQIIYHKTNKTYSRYLMNSIGIQYKFTDDETVYLSDPERMI